MYKIRDCKNIFEGVSLVDDKRGRSGLLWLIFGPFCRISSFDKGILIFRFDLTFTAPSNLTKFGQNGHTLNKLRYVTFENQLRSEAFAEDFVKELWMLSCSMVQ